MTVADLILAAYSLLTIVSVFAAGRLWGSTVGTGHRWVATLFAGAEAILLTYYLVWTDDRFHRASYVIMNAAVGFVVLAAAATVVYALRKRSGVLCFSTVVTLVLAGSFAAGVTIGTRTVFWPPFAFVSACLLAAPVVALVPRFLVPRYQPLRDREFAGWILIALCGLLAVGETLVLVDVVPGIPWFGRPALLHFFLAGAAVLFLGRAATQPRAQPPLAPDQIPWQLFNPPLSPREADLVVGLKKRLTNKELGSELGISESTVKKHLVSVFQKAGVATRQELFEKLTPG